MAKTSLGAGSGEGVTTRRDGSWGASAGALFLMVLFLQAACATRAPLGRSQAVAEDYRPPTLTPAEQVARAAASQLKSWVFVEVAVLEPRGATRVVTVTKAEFQRALQQPGGLLRVEGTP